MSQSNAVLGLKRDADELAGAVLAFKGTAATALVECLQTVLADGEEVPDVEFLFELLGRLVERDRDAVEEADSDRWVQGMELYTLRIDCRKAKDELYAEAVTIRGALVELYGSKRCRFQLGLGERTPRGAADLADEVARLVRLLSRPDLKLPPPPPGLQADPQGWVAILKPRLELLEKLLAAIKAGQRGSQEHVRRERRIQAKCRETHKLVGRSLEALFTLAGEELLADSLRSSARRRARRGNRQRSAELTLKVLKPALASVFEWLRRFFGRLVLTAGRISGKPRFFHWQGGSERPETLLPALARRL
jgi:hypothetical protein